uniref:MYC binding protein n=1 Tax=Gallus gallus TaxID=9031 RepID=A0A8V0YT59_CHICK
FRSRRHGSGRKPGRHKGGGRRRRGRCGVDGAPQGVRRRSDRVDVLLQAADSKREQFRRYLEKSGVLDTLTKVLVALYEEPEKPSSALDFLKHHLGASAPESPEMEALRLEVAELKEKYEAVLEENKKLKTKLAQYEPPQEEKRDE